MYQNIKLYTFKYIQFLCQKYLNKAVEVAGRVLRESGCFESTAKNTNCVPLEVGKSKSDFQEFL